MSDDKLADVIESRGGYPDLAAAAIREAFVVIERDKVQQQVDTILVFSDPSPYPGKTDHYPALKSGAARMHISAGADWARSMAVHYLAIAQWIDEHAEEGS